MYSPSIYLFSICHRSALTVLLAGGSHRAMLRTSAFRLELWLCIRAPEFDSGLWLCTLTLVLALNIGYAFGSCFAFGFALALDLTRALVFGSDSCPELRTRALVVALTLERSGSLACSL